MTTTELYREIRGVLQKAGVENAGFDADALLRHATGHGRFDDAGLSLKEREAALALAGRRAKREPLQYILGRWPFMEIELEVGPGVLVPRPETEEVCLAALRLLEDVPAPRVLDLCAGSGALALGVQSQRPDARVEAVEWDGEAYAWLERNIAAHAGRWPRVPGAVRANALEYCRTLPKAALDLAVCNPPYVTEDEYRALAPELYHEPRQALVPQGGEEDGLLFYREIAQNALPALKPGGYLVFETGAAQGAAVRDILLQNGYAGVDELPDLAGLPRVALGARPRDGAVTL